MRREIHLIDGTVLVKQEADPEGAECIVKPEYSAGGDKHLDPILSKLRSLRTKAKRLGVWSSVLVDTERGLVNASLLLTRIGRRIRIILLELSLKLQQRLRDAVLGGLRELGATVASRLVSFFCNTGSTNTLLHDSEYLIYLGLRERAVNHLRAQIE
jgi:hypothetical protein